MGWDRHPILHQPVSGCWLPWEEPGAGTRHLPLAEGQVDEDGAVAAQWAFQQQQGGLPEEVGDGPTDWAPYRRLFVCIPPVAVALLSPVLRFSLCVYLWRGVGGYVDSKHLRTCFCHTE